MGLSNSQCCCWSRGLLRVANGHHEGLFGAVAGQVLSLRTCGSEWTLAGPQWLGKVRRLQQRRPWPE